MRLNSRLVTLVLSSALAIAGTVDPTEPREKSDGGLRLDYWVSGEGGESHPDNSAGNLGFRVGLGVRLGRIVGEARYRFALGDVRVHSANSGPDGGWSAYELGVGVLF